jgi:hypothetical protein
MPFWVAMPGHIVSPQLFVTTSGIGVGFMSFGCGLAVPLIVVLVLLVELIVTLAGMMAGVLLLAKAAACLVRRDSERNTPLVDMDTGC